MKQQLQVVMIPTKEITVYEETNYASGYVEHKGKLYLEGTLVNLFLVSGEEIKEGDWFILKDGDYKGELRQAVTTTKGRKELKIIATTDKSLFYSKCNHCGKSRTFLDKCNDCKKEGGTHGQLPQIPQDFIKYFVEKQGNVGKVMVEYEEVCEGKTCSKHGYHLGDEKCDKILQPKLTKDNEVIISLGNIPSGQDLLKMSKQAAFDAGIAYQKSLEEKSYTRDEMIAFGQKCGTAGTMAERIGEDFNLLFLQLVEQNL